MQKLDSTNPLELESAVLEIGKAGWHNDREQILTSAVHLSTYDVHLYRIVPPEVFLNVSRYRHVVGGLANNHGKRCRGQRSIGRNARFEEFGSVCSISFVGFSVIGPDSFEDALKIFMEV
jgi:hypothetical protein